MTKFLLLAVGNEDTSKTLALDLSSTSFNFLAAQQAAAARAAAAAREAAAQKRAEENTDGLAEEEPLPSAPPSQSIPEDPPAVGALLRHESDPNLFYVAFRGDKNPGMFVCNFGGGEIVEQRLSEAGVLRGLSVSRSGQFLAVGGEEGKVRAQPWGGPERAKQKGWQSPAHDGACLAAASFDDAFLLSAGASGVLLAHRLELDGVAERDSSPGSFQEFPGQEPVDITEETAYSLEDAKQKEEADKLRAAALRRQMSVKEQLAEIRRELKEEIERNRNLPAGQRVAPAEMEVDPGLRRWVTVVTYCNKGLLTIGTLNPA